MSLGLLILAIVVIRVVRGLRPVALRIFFSLETSHLYAISTLTLIGKLILATIGRIGLLIVLLPATATWLITTTTISIRVEVKGSRVRLSSRLLILRPVGTFVSIVTIIVCKYLVLGSCNITPSIC